MHTVCMNYVPYLAAENESKLYVVIIKWFFF